MRSELVFMLGGPQGAGLETSAQILTTSLAHLGYGVVSDREYHSNIRGKHSYVHFRASSEGTPLALTYPVDLLGAMDAETVFTHYHDLAPGGFLVYDESQEKARFDRIPSMGKELKARLRREFAELGLDGTLGSLARWLSERGIRLVGISYPDVLSKLAEKYGLQRAQASRYVSSILVGAVAGLMGLDEDAVRAGIERRFAGREALVEQNTYLASMVAETVRRMHGEPLRLESPAEPPGEVMVASGNDVVALGKVVGGLRFQAYYPITPAADESFLLERYERVGEEASLVVLQTEDEIAAISSVIGAALTGARAATATSGPGFSLMVEALGWAGINEVPIVITYYQRGGPSTGLPTRGSQSDLFFTLFASHGEFPRIVLASGDHLEAFRDAVEAFNLAERYQTPVIHLVDKFLANTIATMPVPDPSGLRVDRGLLAEEPGEGYKRFDLSSTLSPRAFLGAGPVMWFTGDEHDEAGHITEDPELRAAMYEKRMRKLELADREIPPEERAVLYGSRDADILLLGWGSVKGVALDAARVLEREGISVAYLHLRILEPFPSSHVRGILEGFGPGRVVAVEHSYNAQSAMLVALKTGFTVGRSIVKYTGRPIYTNELVDAVKRVLKGEERVVLSYGA